MNGLVNEETENDVKLVSHSRDYCIDALLTDNKITTLTKQTVFLT